MAPGVERRADAVRDAACAQVGAGDWRPDRLPDDGARGKLRRFREGRAVDGRFLNQHADGTEAPGRVPQELGR